MSFSSRPLLTFIALISLFASSAAFADAEAGDKVVSQGDLKEDTYLAGGKVHSMATVTGDVTAAGGEVEIENEISGDVLVAGGNVKVRARVGDDVRVAGGEVIVSSVIEGDAIIAGGEVTLSSDADVGGRAWLTGGKVEMYGNVDKGLRIAGGQIVIGGRVSGDVELYGDEITILSSAKISGNVRYYSRNEITVEGGAAISGEVTRDDALQPRDKGSFFFGLVLLLGLVLAAIVFFVLFPTTALGGANAIIESPWTSLAIGFVLLILTPVASLLLFFTFIGIWLGLVLIALYMLLLLLGYLTGVILISDIGLRRIDKRKKSTKGMRMASIALAFLAIAIISMLPVVGGVVKLALLLLGIGGLALNLSQRYMKAR